MVKSHLRFVENDLKFAENHLKLVENHLKLVGYTANISRGSLNLGSPYFSPNLEVVDLRMSDRFNILRNLSYNLIGLDY